MLVPKNIENLKLLEVVGVFASANNKHQQTYIDKKLGLTSKLSSQLQRGAGGEQIRGLKSL